MKTHEHTTTGNTGMRFTLADLLAIVFEGVITFICYIILIPITLNKKLRK